MLDHVQLRGKLASGLLSFPVTDIGFDGRFDADGYADRVAWLSSFPVAGLFAAGGTGELFSLAWQEYREVIRTAVGACAAGMPIIAGVGYGTQMAIEMAREAQEAGAHGLLVLPHYLTEASDEGIQQHIGAICDAVDIGVIYYARGNSRLKGRAIRELAEAHANFIGYKDGIGDVQALAQTIDEVGDRLVYIGGVATAEVYAQAYLELGVSTYSSAIFNILPELALDFYNAVRARNRPEIARLLREFYLPFVQLRDRRDGYAVSLVKAGATLVGRPAGPVRTPLTEPTEQEVGMLSELIARVSANALAQP